MGDQSITRPLPMEDKKNTEKNAHIYPCAKCDLNPRSHCLKVEDSIRITQHGHYDREIRYPRK
jgi:hypothetical protein